jgi:hypothetical protein
VPKNASPIPPEPIVDAKRPSPEPPHPSEIRVARSVLSTAPNSESQSRLEEAPMHDLDRALQEFESSSVDSYEFGNESEGESDYERESEYDGEGEGEYQGEGETDYENEYQSEGAYQTEGEGEYQGESEGEGESQLEYGRNESEAIFDEIEEMEQAAALLEVQDEGELDQFLGSLIRKVAKKLNSFLPPDLQTALSDTLSKVAKVALPKVGAALGNLVVPGAGGVLGAAVGSNASKLFGLELEGLSHEDQEFEVARRIVSLGAEATKAAGELGAPGEQPADAAKNALVQASQTHAPGLAAAASSGAPTPPGYYSGLRYGRGPRPRSGRWFRRGRRIILVGV